MWHDCNGQVPHEWEWGCPYSGCPGGENHEPWMTGHEDWDQEANCVYYDWRHHREWEWIDLREIGWPTEYYPDTRTTDQVPVIEAQSVIDQPEGE